MDFAVYFFLFEARMILERMSTGVFQDEITLRI